MPALDDEIGRDLLGPIVRDQLRTAMEHIRDVALATNSVFSVGEEEIARALLGPEQVRVPLRATLATDVFRTRDGLLMSRGGPRHTRVSGFILVSNVAATHLPLAKPEVWLNPWAPEERRFTGTLPGHTSPSTRRLASLLRATNPSTRWSSSACQPDGLVSRIRLSDRCPSTNSSHARSRVNDRGASRRGVSGVRRRGCHISASARLRREPLARRTPGAPS
jgi:hypothetical protein